MASCRNAANSNISGGKTSSVFAVGQTWIDQECEGCHFADVRLRKRFLKLTDQISQGVGESIPLACEDWSNTKAAYRFFSNERVTESDILEGHFQATRRRFAQTEGVVLILHDTTEFVYQREKDESIGKIGRSSFGRDYRTGIVRHHTVRGILMHSSLAITAEGLPLGISAAKFWTRKQFKGCNALKRRINPTRIPIEEKESFRWIENIRQSTRLLNQPERCVHIGDRESDIFELFCSAQEEKTNFLVRTCVDRLAGDGGHTILDEMKDTPIRGRHRIDVRDAKGDVSEAVLQIRYRRILVRPPLGKNKQYPVLKLTVIHAQEQGSRKGRDRIDWKLITNLDVSSLRDAVEKLTWYAMRWKIETFHKILKSGCKAEESKLRSAQRLTNLIALYCIVGWRVFWLTMSNRTTPEARAANVFTSLERGILDQLVRENETCAARKGTVGFYLIKLARLGGYLARKKDPPPGNTVMWRGMSRLNDIQLGFLMGAKLMGN